MPEGDTVYRAARRLDSALTGRPLRRGELRHPRLVVHDLAGLTVLGVRSVGKHLLTRFDDGRSLHTHLGMDGSWQVYPSGRRWHHPAHQARAVLATEEQVVVGFRLHGMRLVRTRDESRLVGHLGPDLLDPAWSDEHLAEGVRRLAADPAAELGLALLDQRVVAGVGNIYRAETCFLLGVSPWTPVAELPDPARAIELAGELLRRGADGPPRPGPRRWVYQRAGRPCRRCGSRVSVSRQGHGIHARETYYCPTCQPGPTP